MENTTDKDNVSEKFNEFNSMVLKNLKRAYLNGYKQAFVDIVSTNVPLKDVVAHIQGKLEPWAIDEESGPAPEIGLNTFPNCDSD